MWFYLLVLPVAIFPWSPLLLIGISGFFRNAGRKLFADQKVTALVAWTALPFVFFSASANKLPGYLLPILPPLSLMLALALADEPKENESQGSIGLSSFWKRTALCATAAFLLLVPLFSWILPESLATGLSTAMRQMSEHGLLASISSGGVPTIVWTIAVASILAAIVLAVLGSTLEAGGAIAIAVCICLGGMLVYMSPIINSIASVRNVAQRAVTLGVDPQEMGTLYIHRTQVYGLGFYFGISLPEWRPDDPNQQFSYIAARDDFKVDEFRPGAHLMARFPRQNLSLWSLPAQKIPEVRVPASLREMRN
jgi:4-amino-4-deoxy-L-arabinose transferase-like glycosyltransferase